jgi:hypothetical protein
LTVANKMGGLGAEGVSAATGVGVG